MWLASKLFFLTKWHCSLGIWEGWSRSVNKGRVGGEGEGEVGKEDTKGPKGGGGWWSLCWRFFFSDPFLTTGWNTYSVVEGWRPCFFFGFWVEKGFFTWQQASQIGISLGSMYSFLFLRRKGGGESVTRIRVIWRRPFASWNKIVSPTSIEPVVVGGWCGGGHVIYPIRKWTVSRGVSFPPPPPPPELKFRRYRSLSRPLSTFASRFSIRRRGILSESNSWLNDYLLLWLLSRFVHIPGKCSFVGAMPRPVVLGGGGGVTTPPPHLLHVTSNLKKIASNLFFSLKK